MEETAYIDTRFLVLRTTQYSDSSLIVAGISPDRGQIRFVFKGARRLGAKRFPVVDLFRLLQVQYRARNADLQQLRKAELVEDYGALARRYDAYRAAGWLARFALANVPEALDHPQFFHTMCLGLKRLADLPRERTDISSIVRALVVGVCLTFLHEAGLLADYADDERSRRQCLALLDMAAGDAPAPRLTAQNWIRLQQWVIGLLQATDCHVPESAPTRGTPSARTAENRPRPANNAVTDGHPAED